MMLMMMVMTTTVMMMQCTQINPFISSVVNWRDSWNVAEDWRRCK